MPRERPTTLPTKLGARTLQIRTQEWGKIIYTVYMYLLPHAKCMGKIHIHSHVLFKHAKEPSSFIIISQILYTLVHFCMYSAQNPLADDPGNETLDDDFNSPDIG